MKGTRTPKGLKSLGASLWPVIGLAVLITTVAMFLLWSGRPSKAETRLATLESQLAGLQRTAQMTGDLSAFGPGSVCAGKLNPAYADQLGLAITGTGLEVTEMGVATPVATNTKVPLMAYPVTLKASGSYEAAMTALEALDRLRPVIYVDQMALRNRTDRVDLELTGRVFCR